MAKQKRVVSSMPKNPAVSGRSWTSASAAKVNGRSVVVGWIDAPAQKGMAVALENGIVVLVQPGTKGRPFGIDSPDQIISVGDLVRIR